MVVFIRKAQTPGGVEWTFRSCFDEKFYDFHQLFMAYAELLTNFR